MLTNLNFLRPGASWPPKGEEERMKLYYENKLLFDNEHAIVFKENWERLLREGEKLTIELVLNWPKRLSLLWADLLLGEPPQISAGDQGSPEQEALDRLVKDNELYNAAYETAIDVSRYGTGLFKIRLDGTGIIEVLPPTVWYPVVEPTNIKKVTAHVLAWVIEEADQSGNKQKRLEVEIHERGRITYQQFKLAKSGDKIGTRLDEDVVEETGIDAFLVVPAPNVSTSDKPFGIGADDYSDLDSIVSELEVRVAQISKILDRHADPNMYGDEAALEQDPVTGEWKFRGGGRYFPVTESGQAPGYVSWDGQLDAAFKQLDALMEQFYALSETSAAAFGQLKQGLAESGSALRRLMMAPLAKTKRIRMRFDPALKKALQIASQLEVAHGVRDAIPLEDISITWQDGLPDDETESTENITKQVGAGVRSKESAVRRLQDLDGERLQEELDRIAEDESQSMPPAVPSSTQFNFGQTGGGAQ